MICIVLQLTLVYMCELVKLLAVYDDTTTHLIFHYVNVMDVLSTLLSIIIQFYRGRKFW